jgi:hypothetical protein
MIGLNFIGGADCITGVSLGTLTARSECEAAFGKSCIYISPVTEVKEVTYNCKDGVTLGTSTAQSSCLSAPGGPCNYIAPITKNITNCLTNFTYCN